MSQLALLGGTPVRTKPYPSWPQFDARDEENLLRAFRSGTWGIGGTETVHFEEEFAAAHDAAYGRTVVNGTVSLVLALQALGIEAGDEVLVPPYTFLATATAVCMANAVPVFVDIDPETYNLNPALLEAAITRRTRAIIPVHFAGLPADMDAITRIAAKHGLSVIEDAAHAHGSSYRGRKVGSLGNIGSFSFQASKNLTCGEGGICTTQAAGLAARLETFRNCGRVEGGAWYEHSELGGNFRMTQLQAALLRSQLTRLETQTALRDQNAQRLDAGLKDLAGLRPMRRDPYATRVSGHLYVMRFQQEEYPGLTKQRFAEALKAEGIPASTGYPLPIYRQEVFLKRHFGPYTASGAHSQGEYGALCLPACERACKHEALWLPQNVLLGDSEDLDDILNAIRRVHNHYRALL